MAISTTPRRRRRPSTQSHSATLPPVVPPPPPVVPAPAPAEDFVQWAARQARRATREADEGHWLLVYGLAAVVLSLLFAGFVLWRLDDARHGVDAIVRDSIASIDAADETAVTLNQVDTASVDNALAGPTGSQTAREALSAARQQTDLAVRHMAQNATLGAGEDTAISNIQVALTDYGLRLGLESAQLGLGFPLGMDHQRAASDIMDERAIPNALAVDAAHTNVLASRYAGVRDTIGVDRLLVLALGLGLGALLVVGQVFLFRFSRRVFNWLLLVATVVLALFMVVVEWGLANVDGQLQDATESAYVSIHNLRLAQVDLEQANRYQHLYLLQPGHGARYDRDFALLSRRIFCAYPDGTAAQAAAQDLAAARVPSAACQPIDQTLANQLRYELSSGHPFSGRAPGKLDPRYTGYLAGELGNITYGDRELDEALNTLLTLGVYLSLDGQVREMDTNGQHAEALAFALGTDRGAPPWSLAGLKEAFRRVVDINAQHYFASTSSAYASLDMGRFLAPLVGLLAVALIWLGLQPILARYRLASV